MIEISKASQLFSPSIRQPKKLLAIFAHPDDESLRVGGLLADAKTQGVQTSLLCLTAGERGITDPALRRNILKRIRAQELVRASSILGIRTLIHHAFPDGKLHVYPQQLRQTVENVLGEIKPHVVVTHDPSGITGHPDHITLSAVVISVMANHGLPDTRLYLTVLGGKEKRLQRLARPNTPWASMPLATHVLSVGPYAETKIAACRTHVSQRLTHILGIENHIWFRLFDREYFHLVHLARQYQFIYVPFQTAYLRFVPEKSQS